MSTTLRVLIVLGVLGAGAVGAFLLLRPAAPDDPAVVGEPEADRDVAGLLPADTVGYVRLRKAGTLVDRVVADGVLADAGPVRAALSKWYGGAFDQLASQKEGLRATTLRALAGGVRSIHVGAVPYRSRPGEDESRIREAVEPVVFVELASVDLFAALAAEAPDLFEKIEFDGLPAWRLKESSEPAVVAALEGTLVAGREHVVQEVLAARSGGAKTLAGNPAYIRALADFGGAGDLFGYFDVDRYRAIARAEIDGRTDDPPEWYPPEERDVYRKEAAARKEEEKKALETFVELGAVSGALRADGRLVVRAYAAAGQRVPAFLLRPSSRRKLLDRIPAAAVLATSVGFSGGKEMRRSLADWIREKTSGGIRLEDLPIEAPYADVLTNRLEELESEVVVMSKEFLVAALPVDREFALAIVPDDAGRWGAVAAFDYQDRAQVDALFGRIFAEGSRADLAWKETESEGLKIRYLDLAELAAAGGEPLPKELAMLQLQVGFAVSEEYAYAGCVPLIEALHRPRRSGLGSVIDSTGIDAENAVLTHLRIGPLLHGRPIEVGEFPRIQAALARQIPASANWSISIVTEPDAVTLRSNVPFGTLAAWVALDEALLQAFGDLGQASPEEGIEEPNYREEPPIEESVYPEERPDEPGQEDDLEVGPARDVAGFFAGALGLGEESAALDVLAADDLGRVDPTAFEGWRRTYQTIKDRGFTGSWRIVLRSAPDGLRAYAFPELDGGSVDRTTVLYLRLEHGQWRVALPVFDGPPAGVEVPR